MGLYKCLERCCAPIPQRFLVATAVLGNMVIMFLHRTCFNLAITEMAFRLNVTEEYQSQVCNISGSPSEENPQEVNQVAEFNWSKGDQALLLRIFYLGYILTHIPGGIICDKYGPKNITGYGMLVSGVCTLLTPLSARLNFYTLVLLRFVMGMAQGPLFPSQSSFVARWSFPNERNLMNSYMNIGSIIGPVVGHMGTGFLIHRLNTWEVVFYVFGGITVPFYVFWVIFAHNKVASHPFITEKERSRLNSALSGELIDHVELRYAKILKSIPVWAMITAGFGHDWAFYIILTILPQYMSYVLLFNIEENGVLLCLPYLCMFVVQMIAPYVARVLITKGIFSKTVQCKIYFVICNEGAVLCFLAATYAKCNRTLVVALFSSAMGVLGMIYSCIRVVQIDLAPNVAGFLMGLMNGIGAAAGFVMPRVFALFTEMNTVEGWRDGFIFTAILITITTVVFLILGTSEVQDWNFPTTNQDQTDEGMEQEQSREVPGKQNKDE